MKVTEIKTMGTLAKAVLTHEVKDSTVRMDWKGPRITMEVWKEVMAFFEWTQKEHHSEAMVRLYVNNNEWKAWAPPQEGGKGMTVKEVDNDDMKQQLSALLPEQEGWMWFATIHHHCSAGAFQSGTDSNDESKIDGLHITVGNMDRSKRTLHYRFTVAGLQFTPTLSDFFDGGETFDHPVIKHLPSNVLDSILINMLCEPSGLDWFPSIWKQNYLVKPAPSIISTDWESYPSFGGNHVSKYDYTSEKEVECIIQEIMEFYNDSTVTVLQILENTATDPDIEFFCDLVNAHRMSLEEIVDAVEKHETSGKETAEEKDAEWEKYIS